ncbi:sulfite exporter TauE/SafE family protein [Qipengyuania sp. 1NDW9]|uniref:Probable membrane transporter protein n=2 Tax=Qipengyuania TaxID=1855416 RepID=A0A9Q3S1N3_9SPHN|nr:MULTISPECIES: sulfite exporter TauE/SafE family protein [Qipengyuania]MBX7492257.1 sulfite exporter TauE/SafE family protein [Qipengyuania xiapuensis]MBY6127916.1 sulfite exporter TauE/SafE family protein [Qipengyuania aquimaris]MBY6218570.1 sulfite exporter TauE/SafE family protein [Qipengyuania aquimaris]QZD93511.1 sulfite exporter TauE/SafE family protein [Qipengyuania xiapuensis]UOR15642.1 sulfite exporter TauE/SafE family protein [Qipengyuania aquimaris]
MDVYLPIANLSVNGLWIVALGALTGVLSGLFGVGGGFLTTPLLIFYGIPPTVAAASASTQVTGASVSGVIAHGKRKGVDYRMGAVMVGGGIIGAAFGALLFRFFRSIGQIDVVINALYVVLLGSIGILMARESLQLLRRTGTAKQAARRRHHPLVANLPWRWRFYGSGLYISPLAPLIVGIVVGILTMLMGVGGGFILVPAMLYILGMSANVVVGTSLFNILFVTIATTIMHSLTTRAVDIVLVGLLLIGSVTGAQFGSQLAVKAKPEVLRLVLAAIVLLIAFRMFLGLFYQPDEIYTVYPL